MLYLSRCYVPLTYSIKQEAMTMLKDTKLSELQVENTGSLLIILEFSFCHTP